jgi:hypothetical protein
VVAVLLGLVSPAAHPAPDRTVAVYGDSLMAQASRPFARLMGSGVSVADHSFPSLAACDFLPTMLADATTRPTVAIIEFSGNAATPCISPAGYETGAYFRAYQGTVLDAVQAFVAAGTHVFLVGNAPTLRQVQQRDPNWNTLNHLYDRIAARFPGQATFVNAGATVESPTGQFIWTHGPWGGGVTAAVRAPDGQHFCHQPTTTLTLRQWWTCGITAPGAWAYAGAIATSVARYLRTGAAPSYVGPPLDPAHVAPTMAAGQVDPY